jgi:hypothetical protein
MQLRVSFRTVNVLQAHLITNGEDSKAVITSNLEASMHVRTTHRVVHGDASDALFLLITIPQTFLYPYEQHQNGYMKMH